MSGTRDRKPQRPIRWGKKRGGPRVRDYETVEDGRLILGTPCFSGARLKRRFADEQEVRSWLKANPKMKEKNAPYSCHMCGGWHLSHREGKK